MIVRCRTNKGRDLPPDYRGMYFTDETIFYVTPGKSYRVYEMALFKLCLLVFIVDDARRPDWYPMELFEVEDGSLPGNWMFALREEGEKGTQAVWGHPRLVGDPDLDYALADQDPDAQVVFWREIVMPEEIELNGANE